MKTAHELRKAAPLDRPTIMAAAVALVDRDGLAGLNMRALAQELGVGTMSLYHYFPNKEAMLNGIVEAVLSETAIPDPAVGTWDQRATRMAVSFRDVCSRHPNAVPLLVTRPFATEGSLPPCEAAFGLLYEGGMSVEQALIVFRAMVAYILGWVMMESAGFFGNQSNGPSADELLGLGLPNLAAVAPHLADRDVPADFEAGFRVILFGTPEATGS